MQVVPCELELVVDSTFKTYSNSRSTEQRTHEHYHSLGVPKKEFSYGDGKFKFTAYKLQRQTFTKIVIVSRNKIDRTFLWGDEQFHFVADPELPLSQCILPALAWSLGFYPEQLLLRDETSKLVLINDHPFRSLSTPLTVEVLEPVRNGADVYIYCQTNHSGGKIQLGSVRFACTKCGCGNVEHMLKICEDLYEPELYGCCNMCGNDRIKPEVICHNRKGIHQCRSTDIYRVIDLASNNDLEALRKSYADFAKTIVDNLGSSEVVDLFGHFTHFGSSVRLCVPLLVEQMISLVFKGQSKCHCGSVGTVDFITNGTIIKCNFCKSSYCYLCGKNSFACDVKSCIPRFPLLQDEEPQNDFLYQIYKTRLGWVLFLLFDRLSHKDGKYQKYLSEAYNFAVSGISWPVDGKDTKITIPYSDFEYYFGMIQKESNPE